MNAGRIGYRNEDIYRSYESLLEKKIKPDLVILYGGGNWIQLFDIYSTYFGDRDLFLKKWIPNFPKDLSVREEFMELEAKEKKEEKNVFTFPLFIRLQAYYSPFFGSTVRNISLFQKAINQFLEKPINISSPTSLEKEVIYLSKIISLAKATNTPIVIVKPFLLFRYPKFTEIFWKTFYQFHYRFSDLPKVRERISEADLLYDDFKGYAYILDPSETIFSYIRSDNDLADAKSIMLNDFVHFSPYGSLIVGKYIGDQLISLGLVRKISEEAWVHPNEIDSMHGAERRNEYLKYRDIGCDYKNYKMYLSCLFFSVLCLLFAHISRGTYLFITIGVVCVIFGYLSQKQYIEGFGLPMRVVLLVVFFPFLIYWFLFLKISIKKNSFHITFPFFDFNTTFY
jgi:hypothetical protein